VYSGIALFTVQYSNHTFPGRSIVYRICLFDGPLLARLWSFRLFYSRISSTINFTLLSVVRDRVLSEIVTCQKLLIYNILQYYIDLFFNLQKYRYFVYVEIFYQIKNNYILYFRYIITIIQISS
jgi:hypothetical protein